MSAILALAPKAVLPLSARSYHEPTGRFVLHGRLPEQIRRPTNESIDQSEHHLRKGNKHGREPGRPVISTDEKRTMSALQVPHPDWLATS